MHVLLMGVDGWPGCGPGFVPGRISCRTRLISGPGSARLFLTEFLRIIRYPWLLDVMSFGTMMKLILLMCALTGILVLQLGRLGSGLSPRVTRGTLMLLGTWQHRRQLLELACMITVGLLTSTLSVCSMLQLLGPFLLPFPGILRLSITKLGVGVKLCTGLLRP